MSTHKKTKATVISQTEISEDIFDLRVRTDAAKEAAPGQFAGVFPPSDSRMLMRPISICQADKGEDILRMVYRIAGEGTRGISSVKEGEEIDLLAVLGNGFPLEEAAGKKVAVFGGGIGIPPMLYTAQSLQGTAGEVHIYLGYRNSDTFLSDEFEPFGTVHLASEDGSVGTKGNVLTALQEGEFVPEVIYACGPMPMLRAIKQYAADHSVTAYISLEERMACGVGACLGCVCKTTKKDAHSHVNNARVCTEGPVFLAEDVDI